MDTRVSISDLATSDRVWEAFVKIANESSRNEKIAMLERAKASANSLFVYTLRAVLDNTIIFGVVLKPQEWTEFAAHPGTKTFDLEVSHFLTLLANGQYTRAQAVDIFKKLADGMSYGSLRLLVAIINKDLGAGINTSTVNKVFKNLIPTFPYMRCSLPTQVNLKDLEWSVGVFAQEKADGMFVNINVFPDGVKLLSRQGTEIPIEKQPKEAQDLLTALPKNYQVHGEMLMVDPNGMIAAREIGNGLINSFCKGGDVPEGWSLLFRVWDAVPLHKIVSKGKYLEPYANRFKTLSEHIRKNVLLSSQNGHPITCIEVIETQIVYSMDKAQAFYRNMIASGKEGAVLKNPTAVWRDGTSKEQVKLKLVCDCDLRIVGFEKGEGKFADTLGSIVCQSEDGELQTNVSGFSDKVRNEIWENREKYIDTIVTVKFNDVMIKNGEKASLFLPRFVEFRNDKSIADSLDRVIASKEQAIKLA